MVLMSDHAMRLEGQRISDSLKQASSPHDGGKAMKIHSREGTRARGNAAFTSTM